MTSSVAKDFIIKLGARERNKRLTANMALDHVFLTQKTAKFSNQEVVSYFKLLEDRDSMLRVPVNKASLRTTFQILMYA